MKLLIILTVLLLILVNGCLQTKDVSTPLYEAENSNKDKNESQNSNYKNMTVDELSQKLKSKDFTLVDVHIPEQKHINGTDVFIPYDEIESQIHKLPKDKDTKIVLYCRTGRMSEIAAQKLAEKGYSNVYNVIGGMIEWAKRGYDK